MGDDDVGMGVRSARADTLSAQTPFLICQLKSRSCREESRPGRQQRMGWAAEADTSTGWWDGRSCPGKTINSFLGLRCLFKGTLCHMSRCGTGWPCPWDSCSVPVEGGPEISSLSLGQPGAMMPAELFCGALVCSFAGVSSFGGRAILLVDAGKQLIALSLGCSQGKQTECQVRRPDF